MQNKPLMMMSLKRYEDKLLKVLNDSLAWNFAKLPNNTLDLQIAKLFEECDETIEADDYQHQVEELGDVLIVIGGLARFDEELAKQLFNEFISCLDKYIFMDIVDYAEQKIKTLYKRSYSDGYKHDN